MSERIDTRLISNILFRYLMNDLKIKYIELN